jgi:hypothetical protein
MNQFSPNLASCSSETKHKRRIVPKTKLFVSVSRLQKQMPQPRKNVLSLSPGEDGFCHLETKYDRTVPRPKLSVMAQKLQKQRLPPPQLSWVCVQVKMFLELGN